jgi:hypothetical protein
VESLKIPIFSKNTEGPLFIVFLDFCSGGFNHRNFCHSERSERILMFKKGKQRLFLNVNTDSFAALRMTKKLLDKTALFF